MAKAIISCTGERFDIGDKVKTADGTIIKVVGAAIGQKFYNAELCTKVHPDTPTTAEGLVKANPAEFSFMSVKATASSDASDCVVWGN